MSDNEVNVKVTASTGELASGMGKAPSVVQQAADRMRDSFRKLKDDTKASMGDIHAEVTNRVAGMAGSFGGLVNVLASTRAGFLLLAGVVAAVGFRKSVDQTADMTEKAMDLGRALGVSTNEARVFQAAMDDLGAEPGELAAAGKGLSRQLRENEADMNALGLATRDAQGNLRPMTDLVLDGIAVLNTYKQGADRAMVSQTMFGRGIDASSRLLLLNKQVLDENRQAVADLGLETGENAVAAWKEYDAATDRAALSNKAMVKAIGDSVMPVMTDLVRLFNAAMPAAITVVRGALSGLTAAFLYVKNGVIVLWETINAFVISVAEPIRAVTEAMGRAMVGDFSGAATVLRGIAPTISGAWETAMQRMTESSKETARTVAALFGADTVAGDPGGSRGTKNAPPGKPVKDGADKSQMAVFEAQLEAERLLATQRDALHGMSKQQEQAFWDGILKTAVLSEADRLAVGKKAAAARIAVLQQEAREADQLGQAALAAWEQRAQHQVDMDEEEARLSEAIGRSTKEELLAQEQQFEERRFQIKKIALEANRAALDPERDPVQVAQINAQLEALEDGHQQRMAAIRTQIAKQTAEKSRAVWDDLQSRMSGLWDKGIDAMMQGTLTWRNAFRAVGTELAAWFGKAVVGAQVKSWLQGKAAQLQATLAGTAAEKSAQTAGSAATVATKATEATAVVSANAAEAASGAAASQATIPWVGPVLAAAAFASIFAMVMGARSSIKSASGGYDIPAGVNPMTQLHEQEMVLPKDQANAVRDMARSGGGGGEAVHIHGTPDDTIKLRDLARVLKRLNRNFEFKS